MNEVTPSSSLPSKNDRGGDNGDNGDGKVGSQETTSLVKENENTEENNKSRRGSNNKKNNNRRQYYAFLRCDKLTAPAIFCSLEDCQKYVGHEKDGKLPTNTEDDNVKNNEGHVVAGVEFQKFDNIFDAIEYLEPGSLEQWANKQKENTVPSRTAAGKGTVSHRKTTETVNTTTATPTSVIVTASGNKSNKNTNRAEGKLAANQMALAAATAADEMAAAFQSTPILAPAAAAIELAAAFQATPILDPAFAHMTPLLASLATIAATATTAHTGTGLASLKRSADEAHLDGTPRVRARGSKRVSFSTRPKANTTSAAAAATATVTPLLPITVAGILGSPKNKRGRPRKIDPLTAAQAHAQLGDPSNITGYMRIPPMYAMNKRDQKWEQFYAELVKYKKDHSSHGDFNTKIQGGKYVQLSHWVERTRTHFRALIQETIRLSSSGVASGGSNNDDKQFRDCTEIDQGTTSQDNPVSEKEDRDNAKGDGDVEKVATSETPKDGSTKEDDETEKDATSEKQNDHNSSQEKDDSTDMDAANEEKKIDPAMIQATILRLHAINPLEAQRLQRLHHLGLTFERPPSKKLIQKQEHMIKKQYQDEAEEWEERFQELVVFKDKYGHTNVPAKPKSLLRNWICLQRDRYQRLKEGKPHKSFTKERMDRLAGLGVQFTAARRLPFDERAVKWLDFRTKHGRDPCHITEDGGLVQWIRKQRRRKKELDAGKKTVLTQEQADRLTAWGFVWEGGEDAAATATDEGSNNNNNNKRSTKACTPLINTAKRPWKERFALLVAFHKEHGHCLVPSTYPDLGPWVRSQRKQYKHLQDGKKSQLTPDRISKLEQIGFVFRARRQGDEIAVHIPSAKQGLKGLEDADTSGAVARREEAEDDDNDEEEEDETSSEDEEEDLARLPQQQQPQQQHRKREGVATNSPRQQDERPAVAGVQPATNVIQYQYSNPWDQYDP